MKTIFALAFAFLTFCQLQAQNSLLNFNEEKLINGVSVNVGNTMLKGDMNEIKKSWSSFIKTHLKENMKEIDGVLTLNETVINQITDKRGDLLVYIYNKDNEISLNVAYKLGYDIYLTSAQYSEEFGKLKEFVNYFVYNYYNDHLPKYIKEKSKGLKVLQKENTKAEKSIKKSEKTNTRNQKKISKIETKVTEVENEETKKSLNTSKTNLEKIISENEKQISYNAGLITTQQSIMTSLKPKIDTITLDINSAKLTLIEVRSKVKSFK